MNPSKQAENLRDYARRAWADKHAATAMLLDEAANTIEALGKRVAELEKKALSAALNALEPAEVQRLRTCAEVLEKIASSPAGGIGCNPAELVKIARAALDALEEERT